jgi:uncharacterized membrane protein (Fun14 family)
MYQGQYLALGAGDMSEALPPVITQFGVGGIGGFLVGYAVKKIVKIVAFLLGLSILLLFYLDGIGLITVNYERLSAAASGLLRAAAEFLPVIIGYLPLATSFTAGLTLGLMKG